MRRREFLKNTIYLPAAGITVAYLVVAGCSDSTTVTSTSTTGGFPSGTCTNASAAIGANHGHGITAPTANEISGGVEINISLTAGSGHTHVVSLTAEELDVISTCGEVTKSSTTGNGHSHLVSFTGGF